jgi:hypothetical protein
MGTNEFGQIFIEDIPLWLIIYKVNRLFIVAVKHNNSIFIYLLAFFISMATCFGIFDQSLKTEITECRTNLPRVVQPGSEILRNSQTHRVNTSFSTLQLGATSSYR